mmetsp:Transcript_30201/g.56052  ORF Transcript_30201/g.56052 Transcript_30201/m.56052 type:complete len:151 (+) Transcript_30201:2493-2945(+)
MPPKRNQEVLVMVELWSRARACFETPGRKLTATHYSKLVPKLKTPLDKTRNRKRAAASKNDTDLLENVRKLLNAPKEDNEDHGDKNRDIHPDDYEASTDGRAPNRVEDGDVSRAEEQQRTRETRRRRRSEMSLDAGDTTPKLNEYLLKNL